MRKICDFWRKAYKNKKRDDLSHRLRLSLAEELTSKTSVLRGKNEVENIKFQPFVLPLPNVADNIIQTRQLKAQKLNMCSLTTKFLWVELDQKQCFDGKTLLGGSQLG